MKLSLAKIGSERTKLLSAKTPEQYITFSINSKLPPGKKATITSEWLAKTKYTYEDIAYARNRNPYWRKKKSLGSRQRNLKRPGSLPKKTWTVKEIEEIFDLDKKMVDRDLAKKFKTSLPAINHIRRKFKMVREIFEIKKDKGNKKKIVAYSMRSEKILREELNTLSK